MQRVKGTGCYVECPASVDSGDKYFVANQRPLRYVVDANPDFSLHRISYVYFTYNDPEESWIRITGIYGKLTGIAIRYWGDYGSSYAGYNVAETIYLYADAADVPIVVTRTVSDYNYVFPDGFSYLNIENRLKMVFSAPMEYDYSLIWNIKFTFEATQEMP